MPQNKLFSFGTKLRGTAKRVRAKHRVSATVPLTQINGNARSSLYEYELTYAFPASFLAKTRALAGGIAMVERSRNHRVSVAVPGFPFLIAELLQD